jgi:hypothetical protein
MSETRTGSVAVLEEIQHDPKAALLKYGLDPRARDEQAATIQQIFDNADPEMLQEYLQLVAVGAAYEEALETSGPERSERSGPANWWNCQACRIGFGLVLLALDAAAVYFTGPAGAKLTQLLMKWCAEEIAKKILAGLAVSGNAGAAALIELVCEAIPNTCGALVASWTVTLPNVEPGATVSVENATIFGTGNSGGDLWGWTGGPNLTTTSIDGREVTLSAETKPTGADAVFAVLVRYTTTLDGQSTQRVFAGPVQSDPA